MEKTKTLNAQVATYDDEETISDIISGSVQAENLLCQKYYPHLLRILRKYCFSSIDVEEVVLRAIMKTIEKIRAKEYKHQGKVLAYMTVIGKYICSEMQKSANKNKLQFVGLVVPAPPPTNDDGAAVPESQFEIAKQALSQLDKICQELLRLSIYKGLKPKEIVKIMQEFDDARIVSNRKEKCIQKLRKNFKNITNQN